MTMNIAIVNARTASIMKSEVVIFIIFTSVIHIYFLSNISIISVTIIAGNLIN